MPRRSGDRRPARADSVTTATKSAQFMLAVLRTSAVSGSRTMALRKNVVKPRVRPKPGSTLGWRKPLTDAACLAASGQQHGPARRLGEERLEVLGKRSCLGRARAPASVPAGSPSSRSSSSMRSPSRSSVRTSRPWPAWASERTSSNCLTPAVRVRSGLPLGRMPRKTASAGTWRRRLAVIARVARRATCPAKWTTTRAGGAASSGRQRTWRHPAAEQLADPAGAARSRCNDRHAGGSGTRWRQHLPRGRARPGPRAGSACARPGRSSQWFAISRSAASRDSAHTVKLDKGVGST